MVPHGRIGDNLPPEVLKALEENRRAANQTAPLPARTAQALEELEDKYRRNDSIRTVLSLLGTVGLIAGGYHGFKRSGGDLGPTLGYGLFGGALAPLALPIFFFQGFGKRKKS